MSNLTGKGGFQPGVSGNPGGRSFKAILSAALREALTPERAKAIAENMLDICETDARIMPQVLSIVFDRTEGPVVRDINLNTGNTSSVVLIPTNKREKPLQLMTDGEVIEAEYNVWTVQGDVPADEMRGAGDE